MELFASAALPSSGSAEDGADRPAKVGAVDGKEAKLKDVVDLSVKLSLSNSQATRALKAAAMARAATESARCSSGNSISHGGCAAGTAPAMGCG